MLFLYTMEYIPEYIARHLVGYQSDGNNLRTSSAAFVYHFTRAGDRGLYLKINAQPDVVGLRPEAEHMRFLAGKLEVPTVIDYIEEQGRQYLLAKALPGQPAHLRSQHKDKEHLVHVLAEGLRRIHAVDARNCPFDRSVDALIERVESQLRKGYLGREFLEEGGWQTADEALHWLDTHRPVGEDLVFLHGDYCLPNVLVEKGVLTGFVDWGYAGVGDRWIDIVACVHSVRRNLGEEWGAFFLKEYGVGEMDEVRETYYDKVLVS